jgi:hypothetical protein
MVLVAAAVFELYIWILRFPAADEILTPEIINTNMNKKNNHASFQKTPSFSKDSEAAPLKNSDTKFPIYSGAASDQLMIFRVISNGY